MASPLPALLQPDVDPTPRSAWAGFLRALTPRAIVLAILLSLLAAVILNPIFETAFTVVLGRTLFVGLITLIAGTAAAQWRQAWVPRWVMQSLVLAVAVPLATLAVYLLSTGGDYFAFINHEGRVQGFLLITGMSTIVGLVLALGALERQRDSEARAMSLQLALQREQLDRHAADVRLAVLTAQVEPHFLFNTLANVQALVETGSTRAPAVLRSLIAYLKATMPRLDDGDAQLGREISLARSYLELMQLRMPDRLRFEVECDSALLAWPCPPMLLLTLVENAVRHGIDPSEAGGLIRVMAQRERVLGEGGAPRADIVRLSVHDDGVGMLESAPPGTGLKNLRERLATFYGPEARLELTELVPHGLLAEVIIDVLAMTTMAPGSTPAIGTAPAAALE
ncbi:MAG TPA: histidine kinase [Burkholderiaceae bacterium]|nr:histidine kinase [Burkholderiaceae bacterium]